MNTTTFCHCGLDACLGSEHLRAGVLCTRLEICICAAIQLPTGEIFRGHRHSDAIRTALDIPLIAAAKSGNYISEAVQGFITSRNRFVTREEAVELQRVARIPSADSGKLPERMLFSEDLYLRSTLGQCLPPLASEAWKESIE